MTTCGTCGMRPEATCMRTLCRCVRPTCVVMQDVVARQCVAEQRRLVVCGHGTCYCVSWARAHLLCCVHMCMTGDDPKATYWSAAPPRPSRKRGHVHHPLVTLRDTADTLVHHLLQRIKSVTEVATPCSPSGWCSGEFLRGLLCRNIMESPAHENNSCRQET